MKKYLPIIIACALFCLKGVIVLDPDFGWHLKNGEYILKYGIPRTDPFSYTMPDYPVISHEYAVDAASALFYRSAGMYGLALVYAVLALIPLASYLKDRKTLPFAALCSVAVLSFAGVRPQVITWVFVWWFFMVLRRKKVGVRDMAILIVSQALWANLHGGFFLGVVLAWLYAVLRVRQGKGAVAPVVFAGLVFGATFLNPYGGGMWREIWTSLSDPYLRWSVQEWLPAFAFLDLAFWLYTGLSLGFFLKYRKHSGAFEQLAYLLFFLLAMMSMRNIPLWIIISLPLLRTGIASFLREIPQSESAAKGLAFFTKILVLVCLAAVAVQMTVNTLSIIPFLRGEVYPAQAVRFIRNHVPQGNLLAEYGWGGYLIWQLPGRKVFIDGRMPSWRRERGNPLYSDYAFRDYSAVLEEKAGYRSILEKFRVTHLLLQKEKKARYRFLSWPKKKDRYAGMKKIYEDDICVLYETGVR